MVIIQYNFNILRKLYIIKKFNNYDNIDMKRTKSDSSIVYLKFRVPLNFSNN